MVTWLHVFEKAHSNGLGEKGLDSSSKGDQGASYWNRLCEKWWGPEISSQFLAYRKCSHGDITSNGHNSGGISEDRWHPGCPLPYLLGSGIPLLKRERFEDRFFSFTFACPVTILVPDLFFPPQIEHNYWIQWSLLGVETGVRRYLGGKFNAWTMILHFFTNVGSLDTAGAFEQMALSSPDFTKGNWSGRDWGTYSRLIPEEWLRAPEEWLRAQDTASQDRGPRRAQGILGGGGSFFTCILVGILSLPTGSGC